MISSFGISAPAHAYGYRLSLGVGVAQLNNPSETDLTIGAEFEYRTNPFLGLGAFGNYIFSTPGISILGLPEFFFHPLGGDWLFNAAPIVKFGSSVGTNFGARVGTRFPIPLGLLTLIPSVAVDFISGGRDLIFGLGIQI